MLTQKIQNILTEKYGDYYPENFDFEWSFCRYFWESHVKLPDIELPILELLEMELA